MKKITLCIGMAFVLSCGCRSVDIPWDKAYSWLPGLGLGEEKVEEVPADTKEPIDLRKVKWVEGPDISSWTITHHDLLVKQAGTKSWWYGKAQNEWPAKKGKDKNGKGYVIVGSCYLIVERNGKLIGGCFDHIRPGQVLRGFPLNPPHPEDGKSYFTVTQVEIDAGKVWAVMATYKGELAKSRTNVVLLMRQG